MERARRVAARRYAEMLTGVDGVVAPVTAPGNEHVWHLYVVQVAERDRVVAEMQAAGVGVAIHYPTPVHLTGAYSALGQGAGTFPVAEAAASRIMSIPMFPHLTQSQQERVVDVLASSTGGG